MDARRAVMIAAMTLVVAALSGCILPPTAAPVDPTTSAPSLAPSTPAAPTATPVPTPTPTPTTASAGPAVDGEGCSPALIQAIAYAYDPSTFEPAFPAPEVLAGYDVACEGRQPSGSDAESFALVPAEQVDPEEVRARLVGMGMVEDSLAPGFFDFAQEGTGAVSVQLLSSRMESIGATAEFDDEADWVVFTWYEIGTA